MEKIPLVSVIIPMYNAARFITQTLESLHCQTMQDFEVVIVDDCSTDNSVEVVENFASRVGGGLNLHVIKLPKNSGTPGLPRNVGIQFSRGKYIFFLDSDDLYTPTALEELTTLAEEYQAEIIHMDGLFEFKDDNPKSEDNPELTDMNFLLNTSNFKVTRSPNSEILSEPTLEPQDFQKRLNMWLNWGYRWGTATTFYKRDFWIANRFSFRNMVVSEDMLVNFKGLCLAKRLLRIPNVIYIIRPREGSVRRPKQNPDAAQYVHKWLSILSTGFNEFDNIMDGIDFFKKHPHYRYAVHEFFFQKMQHRVSMMYSQIPLPALNELVKKEFHSDEAAFATYLFNTVNFQQLQIMRLQRELKTALQRR